MSSGTQGTLYAFVDVTDGVLGLQDSFVYDNWGMLLCVAGIMGGVVAGTISDHVFQSRRGPVAALLYGVMLIGAILLVESERGTERVAFALLAAFIVTALLYYLLRRARVVLYVLAGAAAMLTLHLAMNAVFGLTAIAIARSTAGLTLQALAGAAGGFVYVCLNQRLGVRVIDPIDA